MPGKNDICTVCDPRQLKQAALLFDRVYVHTEILMKTSDIPPEMVFCCDRFEMNASEWGMEVSLEEIENKRGLDYDNMSEDDWAKIEDEILSTQEFKELFAENYIELLCYQLRQAGINVTPMFKDEEAFSRCFSAGNEIVYVAALKNMPLVSEDTQWEAIGEFRRDSESLKKYRDLRLWLESGVQAASLQCATDLIAKKIEGYEWAIKKHGLQTVTGVLSHVLDSKSLLAISAGSGLGAALTGQPWTALVGGGLVLTAEITAWVAERLIDLKDIKRGTHSEIAIIYEARRKFGAK